MYIGPDTLMPVASAFAAVGGVLLMFWRKIVGAMKLVFFSAKQKFAKR